MQNMHITFSTHKEYCQFKDIFINGDLKSQVTLFMDCLNNKTEILRKQMQKQWERTPQSFGLPYQPKKRPKPYFFPSLTLNTLSSSPTETETGNSKRNLSTPRIRQEERRKTK